MARVQAHKNISSLLKLIWPYETNINLIRLGNHGDGGYLVPDDLEGISKLFSPGVSDSMTFEAEFLSRGIPCELIDGSISDAPINNDLVSFRQLWLKAESGEDAISLDDWVNAATNPDGDLILQMDIEGFEWEVILACQEETLSRFRIIVLELHDLRSVMSRSGLTVFESVLRKLTRNHDIVHAHPNNCDYPIDISGLVWSNVIELTLLRKDRITKVIGPARLPHPLDFDNTDQPHVRLIQPHDVES